MYRLKKQKTEWVIILEYDKFHPLTHERCYKSRTVKFDNKKYIFDEKLYNESKYISNKKLLNLCASQYSEFEEEMELNFSLGKAKSEITVHDFIPIFLKFQKESKNVNTYARDLTVSKYADSILGKYHLKDINNIVIQDFISNVNKMTKKITTVTPKQEFESKLKELGYDYTSIRREYRAEHKNGINNSTLRHMFDGETISIDSAKKISSYVGLEVRELFDIKEEIKPLMFNTKKKYTDFLSKMLSYAKKYGYISINYFSQENIDMFKEKKRNKDEKCMSFTEFKKYNEYLLNNLDVEDSCVVANLILAETGLRKEELLGLKWSNVDFDRKLFVVRNTVTYNNITKKNINEDETKNDSSFRIVSISNTLVEVLTKYKEHQEKVIASNPNKTVDAKDNWLFMNLKSGKYFGELIFPSTVNSWVNRITELAGVAHYTPHNIRHTYITYLIETGKFSIVEVSRRVGHSDANTTLKVYAHVMHMQDESKTELSYIESIVQREKEKNDADIKKDIIPNGDLETRIARLKKLYDENNITEEQYNRRVNEILSEI